MLICHRIDCIAVKSTLDRITAGGQREQLSLEHLEGPLRRDRCAVNSRGDLSGFLFAALQNERNAC